MFSFKKQRQDTGFPELLGSQLHDEHTFYQAFIDDLRTCRQEVIIESPFITSARIEQFLPIFEKLLSRGVKIYIMTRDPKEHSEGMEYQSKAAISHFERIGVQVFICTGNHHRKLAILDRRVLWEGSLNILSQTHSHEIMRRIESRVLSVQMFDFLKLGRYL